MEYWRLFVKGLISGAESTGKMAMRLVILGLILAVGRCSEGAILPVSDPKLIDATVSDLMVGLFLVLLLFGVIVKDCALVAVSAPFTTATGPVVAPGGTVAVICTALFFSVSARFTTNPWFWLVTSSWPVMRFLIG